MGTYKAGASPLVMASSFAEPDPSLPAWDHMIQDGDVTCEAGGSNDRPRRTLIIRTSSQGGATGSRIWLASNVLFKHIDECSNLLAEPQNILELGSGTGFLALLLAAAGAKGTKVIATEQPALMRGLKYNASRNNLRHAIQCLPWDWAAKDPPTEIDWPQLTMCVASDLVYYEESSGQNRTLARVMRLVLERSRPSLRFLMINRLRVQDGNRLVLPKAPAPGEEDVGGEKGLVQAQRWEGVEEQAAPSPASEMPSERFLTEVLPLYGMKGAPVTLSAGTDPSFRLYQITIVGEVKAQEPLVEEEARVVASCNAAAPSADEEWLYEDHLF